MSEKENLINSTKINEISQADLSLNLNNNSANLIDKEKQNNQINQNTIFYDNLNKIIEDSGYNLITYKVIFFSIMFCFYEGFMLIFFGNITTAFQQYYNISNSFLSFISSLVFLGMSIGSATISFFQKYMNRREIVLMSVFGILISNLLMALIHNLVVFIIFRFVGAVFLGYYMVLTFTILAEYLPVRFRGFIMNFIWISWNIGGIYFLLFCKVYIPKLSYNPNNKTIPQDFHGAIFSIFYVEIINIIIIYFFLKDSPRNLFVNNKKQEAGDILEYYVKRKLTKEELDAIYNNIISTGENKKNKKKEDFRLLFSRRYIKMSILMMIVFFIYSFSMYGMNVSLPIILKKFNSSQKEVHGINSLIIYYSITALCAFIGGFLAEWKYVGKKISSIVLNFIAAVCGIFCLIYIFDIYLIASFSTLSALTAFNLHISWTGEVLPTKLRDLGFGLFLSMTRLGGFIAQFVFIALVDLNIYTAIVVYSVSLFINIILLAFLPRNEIEELDSELELSDGSSEEENNIKENKNENEFDLINTKENK